MAKDDVPGFLSKVARFVRNPLTNWADLDQPEGDKESGYSRAMLKEMIERKRRNDFVRKREFDQLRKLRSRGLMNFDPADRPSFFNSSLPSTPDERAVTLRKIDEIEAQMSQQWWKSKPAQDSGHSASSQATRQSSLPQPGTSLQSDVSRQFLQTEASVLRTSSGDPLPPSRGTAAAAPAANKEPVGMARTPGLDPLPGPSQWLDARGGAPVERAAPVEPGFVHDPELEEAAIRFANGDYEGAESALRALIAPGASGIQRTQTWLTLFDLYRATGQHDRFDNIAIDFANRFGRSAPVWFAMSDASNSRLAASTPAAGFASTPRGFSWSAPDVLSAKAVSVLTTALAKAPEPWRFNWSRLNSIEESALEPLLRLIGQWCGSTVQLRFVGADHLEQVLAESTASGDRTVNPQRWRIRMELLRLMGRADAFDLVALDYCVTYEVSPPSWTDVLCRYQELSGDGVVTGFQAVGPSASDTTLHGEPGPSVMTGPHTLPQTMYPTQHSQAELSGQVVGDAGKALDLLDRASEESKSVTVRCDRLARVDFSAAGSILNWVAARQTEGCEVQFTDVQRLVAVFFNVIGINEHARVTARQN